MCQLKSKNILTSETLVPGQNRLWMQPAQHWDNSVCPDVSSRTGKFLGGHTALVFAVSFVPMLKHLDLSLGQGGVVAHGHECLCSMCEVLGSIPGD